MIFTDYGVPLAVGGQVLTLPVYMYREVIGLMNYSQGAIIGVVLLVPALIEFIMDLKSGDHSVTLQGTRLTIKAHKSKDLMAFYFCSLIVLLLLLPLGTFMVLSFVESYPIDLSFSLVNIQEAFRLGVGMYLKHSIAIAFATAIVGMGITYFTAYITARSKRTFTNLSLHLISLISLAIPGVVLGLCYVLLFHGSFLYGSVFILIQVNITHFFASPYLMAYNSLKRFNANFEDVAAVHGISKMQLLFDVFVPCTKETLLEIFAYLFVNAMVTISAVSFLANFKNMPLSLLIPQFDSQSMIEATAFISIVIFGVNVIVKGIIYGLKKYSGGNE
jgi:iron(III) transport system permease protein